VWNLSLTLREERKLRVFENTVLRRIFGPRRDEVTGEWRLHNEELNDLYPLPNIVWVIKWRRMRWCVWVRVRGCKWCCRGIRDGRGLRGRPRCIRVDNIRMDLLGEGCRYMDMIGLAQDNQVADSCENGNESSGSVKCGEFLD
jgi:hypothetical protein